MSEKALGGKRGKELNRERWERIRISTKGKDLGEDKGEDLRGEKALGGKEGKGPQQGKGAKDLRKEKGEDLGRENALGGKGRERISTRKGGNRS